MCTHLITHIRMCCGHLIQAEGFKIVCEKNCGNWTTKYNDGSLNFAVPCDDCIEAEKWIKEDGTWKQKKVE
ncbi:hypothetical protein ANO11243_066680 [Dothideomycetidae sp. 11243]|nr:hypothetical protein ANO11243_066680 [fungal sp. No.11243]